MRFFILKVNIIKRFPERIQKFPCGALFLPIKSDRISLVKSAVWNENKMHSFQKKHCIFVGHKL